MGSLGNYSGAIGKEVEFGESAAILIRAFEPYWSALHADGPPSPRVDRRAISDRGPIGRDSTQANFDVVNCPIVNQRHA